MTDEYVDEGDYDWDVQDANTLTEPLQNVPVDTDIPEDQVDREEITR